MNIRTVVRTHLMRERIDVLLSVLAPLVLMLESGYANAWVFAGGHLGLDFNSAMALFRGIFLEALIYACFKLVKMFASHGGWAVLSVPALVGVVGMIVSGGCNLGWMANSPEMLSTLKIVSQIMPGWMAGIFRVGLGLLFPVAVGMFALFDVRHLVEDALKSSHLDNKAIQVQRSEMHRTKYLKSLKKSGQAVKQQYDAICDTDAQNMVTKVKGGDLSFGAHELSQPTAPSAVTRAPSATTVSPVPVSQPMFPAGPTPLRLGQPAALPLSLKRPAQQGAPVPMPSLQPIELPQEF